MCVCVAADCWHWQSIDDSVVRMMPSTSAEYRQLLTDYDLCLTGQVATSPHSSIVVCKEQDFLSQWRKQKSTRMLAVNVSIPNLKIARLVQF